MKRVSFLLTVCLLGSMSVGCGAQAGGDSPQAAAPSQADSPSPAPGTDQTPGSGGHAQTADIPRDLAPQDVVGKFLDALRSGDENVAAELLTTTARVETAKHDLAVQPPGTPQATYRVGRVEYVTENRDGAHVTSIWTEPAGRGQKESYEIVWVMRHEPRGWRIAGMATEVVPGQAPLFLNFEDPADMLQKWRNADAELASRQNAAAAQQARQPGATGTRQR